MHDTSFEFLKTLLQTPSPSGYEQRIQEVVRTWARPLADELRTDLHGNVIAVLNPAGSPRIMLAGHCDQLALMVEHIDSDGFLYVQPMGGWDMQILLGHRLVVWTKTGPVPAVVSRKAPHVLTAEERKKVPEFIDVWIDIGAKDRAGSGGDGRGSATPSPLSCHARRCATISSRRRAVMTKSASGPSWRRCGCCTANRCKRPSSASPQCKRRSACAARRHRAAYGIHPAVGIAVDVCHATDTPGNEKKQFGETKLNAGPVVFRGPNINPHVHERLVAAAKPQSIPLQIRGVPKATGTDANAIQLTRDGVAAGLVGLPNRYMHSPVEVVSLKDLDNAAKLLAEFCLAVTSDANWIP